MQLEGKLLRVEVGPELAGRCRPACGIREGSQERFLRSHQEIALGPGSVIEFNGRGDEDAAARQRRVVAPRQPALEEGTEAGLTAGRVRAGCTTFSLKCRAAARSTCTSNSSLERKCANRPLFERPSSAARPPIVTPPRPSRVASCSARSTIRSWVCSPLCMSK